MAEVIRLVDIVKSYIMGDSVVHALDHVNVQIGEGEFTSIMGPSGSGKSTMMNILGCLTGYERALFSARARYCRLQ